MGFSAGGGWMEIGGGGIGERVRVREGGRSNY